MEQCTYVKCKIVLDQTKLQPQLLFCVSKLSEILYIINSGRVYFSRFHVYAGIVE